MNVKRKVHNEYVFPVMVHGSDTWVLKKAHMELLSVAQRKMARIMLGIILRTDSKTTDGQKSDIVDTTRMEKTAGTT